MNGSAPPDSPAGEAAAEASVADMLRDQFSDRNSIIDTALPTVAFLTAYMVTGSQLQPSLVAAVAAGLLVAVLRAVRRESVRHVLGGFLGVAIAAWLANRTGQAEDFFLPGLLLNVAYAAGFAISALIRQPLVGLGIRLMTSDGGAWRDFPPLRRAAYRATWLWAGVFGLRLAVQVPLYLSGSVEALGVAKLVLGFPLFVAGAFATHRILSPALALRREFAEAEAGAAADQPQTAGAGERDVAAGPDADLSTRTSPETHREQGPERPSEGTTGP